MACPPKRGSIQALCSTHPDFAVALFELPIQGLLESHSRAKLFRLAPKGVLICLGSDHFSFEKRAFREGVEQ
jgi:hypothetical protein